MNYKITPLQKEIGQRIKQLRGDSESQQQLGDAIGVSREIIQHWERGSRQIKAEHLCKIAKHFGVSTDYLLGFFCTISADFQKEDNNTMSEMGPEMVVKPDNQIMINLSEMIKEVMDKNVEITVTYEPDRTEMTVQPWRPYRPYCPFSENKEKN